MAALSAEKVDAAWAQAVRDHATQWRFHAPAPPPTIPKWLTDLGNWLQAYHTVFMPLLWIVLVALAIGILVMIAIDNAQARRGGSRPGTLQLQDEDLRPERARAQALLADADRLAAAGDFDGAAHILLLRGVDDIRDRRRGLIKPFLTSREIAVLEALPAQARTTFAQIAAYVERSAFAGRSLGAEEFNHCREAYEAFAFADAWKAA